MKKFTWKKGDILAMPQDLATYRSSIYRGCHVFEAELDPEMFSGELCYGARPATQFRAATVNDIDRLIAIATEEINRENIELSKLIILKQKLNRK